MIPCFVLFVIGLLARVMLRSWAVPSALFIAVWLFYMSFSLVLSPFKALDLGLWWMVMTMFVFFAGDLTGQRFALARPAPPHNYDPEFPFLPVVVLVALSGAAVYFLYSPVYVLPDTMAKPPRWFQIFLASSHAFPMFCGLLYASARRTWHRVLGLSNFVVGVIFAAQQSSRSVMAVSVAFWTATYLPVAVMRTRGDFKVFTRERVPLALSAAVLILVSLIVSTVSRQIEASKIFADNSKSGWLAISDAMDKESATSSWEGLQSSTVGSIASFTWWFDREIQHPSWTMRYFPIMFSGPLEQFGLMDRSKTAFETTYFSDGTGSNVYTLFRPLIEAFTLPGSLIVVFLVGLLGGRSYVAVHRGNVVAISVLAVIIPNVMISGGLWFGYNSIVLAFLSLFFYLLFVRWLTTQRQRARASFAAPPRHLLASAPR